MLFVIFEDSKLYEKKLPHIFLKFYTIRIILYNKFIILLQYLLGPIANPGTVYKFIYLIKQLFLTWGFFLCLDDHASLTLIQYKFLII